MVEAIKDGKRLADLIDDPELVVPTVKYLRAAERIISLKSVAKPRPDIRVIFHYGPPGMGKTRCATDACGGHDPYFFDGDANGFWLGYSGQQWAIFDEFGGHCLKPLTFQRVCDEYPYNINVKGGTEPCELRTIHICSNYLPDAWWSEKTKYNYDAVCRRIHECHYHYAFGRCHVFKSTSITDRLGYAVVKMRKFLEKPSDFPDIVNLPPIEIVEID